MIPLLTDTPWDELLTQLLSSYPDVEHSVKDGIAALELYYPLVRVLERHSLGHHHHVTAAYNICVFGLYSSQLTTGAGIGSLFEITTKGAPLYNAVSPS